MTATNARILEIEPDEYHKRPGLSASYATILHAKSPRHAWAEHPCLGGKDRDTEEDATKVMDLGNVGHALALGKGKKYEVLDFANYTTKAAKEARDAARAAGKVPILADAFLRAGVAAMAVRNQLAELGLEMDGQSELAVEWEEQSAHGPVLCRCMFDHVWLELGRIIDLKFTGDASPLVVERRAENMGYGIQAAAYRRALNALRPELAGRDDFLFVFAETDFPNAINISRPDGRFRTLGEERWIRAVNTWGKCLAEDTWPAFGGPINPITVPDWVFKKEALANYIDE